jgi:hypothetical protein
MSPTLHGLGTIVGRGDAGHLSWAAGLAVAALVTGLGLGGRRLTLLLATIIVAAVGILASVSLLGLGRDAYRSRLPGVTQLATPPGTALLTSSGSDRWLLMKTLFWNPDITRVLVLGSGSAADGFASTAVRLGRLGLVDGRGRPVPSPLALSADTTASSRPGFESSRQIPAAVRGRPAVLVAGWNRTDHYLDPVSWVYAVAGGRPVELSMRLVSERGPKTMSLACGSDRRSILVGKRPATLRVSVPRGTERACRISLVKGAAVSQGDRLVSVKAQLGLG